MTGVSGLELLLVLGLAYLLFGPREAARVFRTMGEVTARCRRFLRQMQQEFDAAMREADKAGGCRRGETPQEPAAPPGVARARGEGS